MKNPLSKISHARPVFLQLNLRAKLILGNMLITLIAITGMGYYVYFRAQQANAYLTTELERSVRTKAEDKLITTSSDQAAVLNGFFVSVSKDIGTLGKTIANLLTQETLLSNGTYWDAVKSLYRLPNGSWDNQNSETSSIFIPATIELTPELVAELNTLKYSEPAVSPLLAANPDIVAIYFGGVSKETVYYPNIDLANIVPPDFDVTGRPWYLAANAAENTNHQVVWSTPYEDAALHGLVVTSSVPIFDAAGKFRGVAAMDIQLNRITDIVANIQAGETGYAFLIDSQNRLIALPQAGYSDFGVNADTVPLGEILDQTKLTALSSGFFELLNKITAGETNRATITIAGSERSVISETLPEVGYNLVIMVPSDELLAETIIARQQVAQATRNTIALSVILVAVILALASIATYGFGNLLTRPLSTLTKTAEQITAGNLDAEADIQGTDEIGSLAKTLNMMTSTIKSSIQTLEQRVTERTAALRETSTKEERRARQFRAITEVARITTAEQNLSDLLQHISRFISEQFDFYHTGIFLNDATNQYAVLSAANSEGGKKMIARRHQLKIGEQGIVGFVTGTGKPRVVRDVGLDAVYFDNPDLPATRSEMALPLKIGGNIIGALDVQSTIPDAFTDEDVGVLSTLADLVSIAIQNARLFAQERKSLTEVEALYRQYLREAWGRLPKQERLVGFRSTPTGVESISDSDISGNHKQEKGEETSSLPRSQVEVPIILRGEQIGKLIVETPETGVIKPDQMDMIRAVAERVALSAENARLFDETSRRAQRERLVSDITMKIRSSNDPQEMIRTTINELRQALGASRVEVIPESRDPKSDH
jgi:GAF domain-containing protein/HAMP domain-containing protein